MSNLNKTELDRLDEEFDFDDGFDFDSIDGETTTLETFDSGSSLKKFDISEMLEKMSAQNEDNRESEPSEKEKKILYKENVEYVTEKPPPESAVQAAKKLIDGVQLVVQAVVEETENNLKPKEKVREYKKKATMEKIVFRKPKQEGSFLPKVIIFLCVCAAVGIFLGLQANSYYIFKKGKVTSTFSCVFSWLLEENMPFSMETIDGSVFGTGFLCGFLLLAVIGILIYLDSDAKKQSRVGHEHGKARLATPKDFKNFKNKFMEK